MSLTSHSIENKPPHIGFGPIMNGWGSWEWVGADVKNELSTWFTTSTFEWHCVPSEQCDVLCFIKHPPPQSLWEQLSNKTRVVYVPIDHYSSSSEIDTDSSWLQRCDCIIVHCERLRRFFRPYVSTEYLDHHVKYVESQMPVFRDSGPILWVGVRTNLPALIRWSHLNDLPRELIILTNPEAPGQVPSAYELGFRNKWSIKIEEWTPQRHLFWLNHASAALDIKGGDFRSRHKPPAKAFDFLAAGLPLAMNADSSSVEHLAGLGFDVVSPSDFRRWLSFEYWTETQAFGQAVREFLSRKRIAFRWRRILQGLLTPNRPSSPSNWNDEVRDISTAL